MATRKLIVYPNKDLMIQAGAQRFVLALLDLLAERLPDGTHRTRVDVALSGGSAAQPLGLALNDPLADAVDWSRVHFWWSDERFVPAYDTDRNAWRPVACCLTSWWRMASCLNRIFMRWRPIPVQPMTSPM